MTTPRPSTLLLAAFLGLLSACGKDAAEPRGPQPPTHVYEYNVPVSFGFGGDATRFEQNGWSKPEPSFTWTEGPAASLAIRVPETNGPVALDLTLEGFTKAPTLPAQPVMVYVNGTRVAEWQVAARAVYHAVIPAGLVPAGGGLLNVDLQLPRAISPAELTGSADPRRLALQCFELKLSAATAGDAAAAGPSGAETDRRLEPGAVVRFGEGQEGRRYQVSGWQPAEAEFAWTTAPAGVLSFELPATHAGLTLKARLAGLVQPPALPAQPTAVFVNGQPVADWSVSDTAEFQAVLPAALVGEGGKVTVELRTPRATSPEILGLAKDPRVLGVRCYDLQLVPTP